MIDISYKKGKWILRENYSRDGITIPKGFKTDLASIPRIFWSFYPPFGDYMNAAIIHDYLYKIKFNRKLSDRIFLMIMKEDKVGWFTRTLFYITVRMFGWIRFNANTSN